MARTPSVSSRGKGFNSIFVFFLLACAAVTDGEDTEYPQGADSAFLPLVEYDASLCARAYGTLNILWERVDLAPAAAPADEALSERPSRCTGMDITHVPEIPSTTALASRGSLADFDEPLRLQVLHVANESCVGSRGHRLQLRYGQNADEIIAELASPALMYGTQLGANSSSSVSFLLHDPHHECLRGLWAVPMLGVQLQGYLWALPFREHDNLGNAGVASRTDLFRSFKAPLQPDPARPPRHLQSSGPPGSGELAKLLASDGDVSDAFGSAVSVSGSTVLVGADGDNHLGSLSGSAYVYTSNDDGISWTQVTKLTASDGITGGRFGSALSVSEALIVVGAYSSNDPEPGAGSAYVYKSSDAGASWEQTAKLLAGDSDTDAFFGYAVSVDGNTIAVGANRDDAADLTSGSVYVFTTSDGGLTWPVPLKLIPSDGRANDFFGGAVSVSGDLLVVGAPGDDDAGIRAGSAYIFRKIASGDSWTERVKLHASDGAIFDYFGFSVSASGDLVVVGAIGGSAQGSRSGSAYVFKAGDTEGSWPQVAKLTADDGDEGDRFGHSVAVDGFNIVVGAWTNDQVTDSGGAYVFTSSDGGLSWTQSTKLFASDAGVRHYFGFSVSVSGGFIVAGAVGDDEQGSGSGSAYVYALDSPVLPTGAPSSGSTSASSSAPSAAPTPRPLSSSAPSPSSTPSSIPSIANSSRPSVVPTLDPVTPAGEYFVVLNGTVATSFGDKVLNSADLRELYRDALDVSICGLLGLAEGTFCVADRQESSLGSPYRPRVSGGGDRRGRNLDGPELMDYAYVFELSRSVAEAIDFPAASPEAAGEELQLRMTSMVQEAKVLGNASQLLLSLEASVGEQLGADVDGFTTTDAADVTDLAFVATIDEPDYRVEYRTPLDPMVSDARLVDDLTEVSVVFADATNRYPWVADPFSCADVLAAAALGSELCQWETSSTLRLLLAGAASTLVPGDLLAVRSDTALRCDGGCDPGVESGEANEVTIEMPTDPVAPAPFVAYDPTVSSCIDGKSTVDASATANGGGRPLRYSWTVLSSPDPLPARLEDAIAAANESFTFFVEDLPVATEADAAGTLPSGSFLGLGLTVTNFVDMTTAATGIDIRRVSNTSYVARINGSNRRSIRIDRDNTFIGTVEGACGAGGASVDIIPEWEVRDAEGRQVAVLDQSNVSTVMLLDAYPNLRTNETFAMVLRAVSVSGDSAPTIRAETRITVDVPVLPLGSRIIGCGTTASAFRVNPDTGRMEGDAEALHVIDASGSWDPNVGPQGSVSARNAVGFFMRAISVSGGEELASPTGSPTTTCEQALADAVADESASDAKIVSLNTAALQGCTVLMDLEVRALRTGASPILSDCSVRVADAATPEVLISTGFSNPVSPTRRLAISATIRSAGAPLSGRWSVLEGEFAAGASLEEAATTAISVDITDAPGAVAFPFSLVISDGMLLGRQSYVFELVAEFQSVLGDNTPQLPAVARIGFTANAAATSGTLQVSPSFGSFATAFDLLASGWEDSDLPLAYEFRATQGTSETDLLLNPTTTSSNRLVDTLLPVGPQGASFTTTLTLTVIDALGATSALSTAAVVVTASSAEEALEAAEALLDDLEAQGFSDSSVDAVYSTFGSAASLIAQALTTDASNATTVLDARELQLRGILLLGEAIEAHPATSEILDSQAASLQALSSSPEELLFATLVRNEALDAVLSDMAPSVLDVAALILAEAEASTTTTTAENAESGGSALRLAAGEAVAGALSNVLSLGDAVTVDRGVAERVGDVAQELQQVRAASLLAKEAPEVLSAAQIISASSIQHFDPAQSYELETESVATSTPSLRGKLQLDAAFLESLGVPEYELFLFGLVALDDSALSSLVRGGDTEVSSDTVENLVSGVQRLAIRLSEGADASVSRVADDFTSDLRGTFIFTLALARDAAALQEEECRAIQDASGTSSADQGSAEAEGGDGYMDDESYSFDGDYGGDYEGAYDDADSETSSDCDASFQCAAYNRERGAFQALEECVVEQLPADSVRSPFGSIRCTCAFSGSLQRLLQSADGDVDSTVSLDFGTLMVTSGGTFNNFRSFGEPQPLVLVTVLFFTLFFVLFAYLAERLDSEDRGVQKLASNAEVARVRAWMERCKFPAALVAKLLADNASQGDCCAGCRGPSSQRVHISGMEDVRLLKRQTWSEVADFCQEHDLAQEEAQLLHLSLATAGRGDLQLQKNASGGKEVAKVAGAADESVDPRKLARALHKAPRLDVYFWYGPLLATPQRLLDYQERSLSSMLWRAMKTRHDAFDALSLHAGDAPTRLVRVLYFATSTFATLFVTAVIYQVIYPADDAFCNDRNSDEATCEAPASRLNAREDRCYWIADTGQCRPTEPDPSTSGVLVAAAFALVFMAPVAVFFRWHVNAFLSEAPPRSQKLLQARKLRRKATLARSEGKRARQMQAEELALLRERPEYRPWLLQRLWPRCLADALMKVQVARAARHAAQLETDLGAERSTWPMHERGDFSQEDYADLVQEAMERKLLVTTVAVRDSLPWLKRLVFRSYTSFSVISEGASQRVRYLAIAAMLAFDAFCIAYLLAFGANVTLEQALGWLVSFLLGEIVVVFLLITLRITILNVVMPALVRPDVTVERAVYNMPHFSAAGIFARQRPDLVPGLASVFDARFRASGPVEGETELRALPHGSRSHSRSSALDGPSLTRTFESGSLRALAEEPVAPQGDNSEGPRESDGSLGHLVMRLAQTDSAAAEEKAGTPVLPPSDAGAPFPDSARNMGHDRSSSRFSSRRKAALRQMGSLTVTGITEAYKADVSGSSYFQGGWSFGTRGSTSASDPERRGSKESLRNWTGSSMRDTHDAFRFSGRLSSDDSIIEADMAEGRADAERGSGPRESDGGSSGKRPEDYADFSSTELKALKAEAGRRGSRSSIGSRQRTSEASVDAESVHTPLGEGDVEGGREVHILDASKTLRRRNPLLKWSTRLLLCLLALVLIWPEPVQEFLLEEGIPVGLALMLIVGLRLDVDEGIEVLVSFFIISVIAAFGLLVVYFVSLEILRNLRAFRQLWRPRPTVEADGVALAPMEERRPTGKV